MKKVLRYLLMTVMAICFSIPCFGAAEAASVALLPLINNVEGGDELANQVFYKNALAVLNSKKGFVVVENDKLTAVIDAAKVGNKVPSAATLEKIAKDGDQIKTIRFGQQGVTGDRQPTARQASFKARHAKNIAKGKMSAAYWADKVKW